MSGPSFPLDSSTSQNRRPSARFNNALERLMDDPIPQRNSQRKTPVGTDTAWALKLKTCVDTVARELNIQVIAAKPIKCFGLNDTRDMLFEVDTSRGTLEVLRARTGEHTFTWKCTGVQIS